MSSGGPLTKNLVSPIRCNEKPWDFWVSEIGHKAPRLDDDETFATPAPKGGAPRAADDTRSEPPDKITGRRAGGNRLKFSTMSLHGFMPQIDNLNAAVCHMCGMAVKCSAAHRHLTQHHSHTELILPPPPPASSVKTKHSHRSKHKKDAPIPPSASPSVNVAHKHKPAKSTHMPLSSPMIPPASTILPYYPKAEPILNPSTTEVKVCVQGTELPVVSIQDNAELTLGDNLTDEIFEIMNSEGISAENGGDIPDESLAWKNIMQDFNSIQEMSFQPSATVDCLPMQETYIAYTTPDLAELQLATPRTPAPTPTIEPTTPISLVLPVVSPSSGSKNSNRSRSRTKSKLNNSREYDPNKHCGVTLVETQKPCTRSLTCKAHTLSLRRAVEGRTKPFDTLLAEHRAAREGAVTPTHTPAQQTVTISIPSPVMDASLQSTGINTLTEEQQVEDLYASLVNSGDAILQDANVYASSLSTHRTIPVEQYFVPEAVQPCEEIPVLSIASPPPPPPPIIYFPNEHHHGQARLAESHVSEGGETGTSAGVGYGDVCWYPASPRPLSVCGFNSYNMGGAAVLGKRFATVRSHVKAALSRFTASNASGNGANSLYNFNQSSIASFTKNAHSSNAAKSSKPEVRKLIMTCPAFMGSSVKSEPVFSVKSEPSLEDVGYDTSASVRHNGHLFGGKRPLLDDIRGMEEHDSKRQSVLRNSLKVKHGSSGDMMELSFMFDPLVAEDKC